MLNMTITTRGFPGGSAGKEPANAGDLRDVGLIPGLERSPGGGNDSYSGILARELSWTEEPGGLQSLVSQRDGFH